MDAKTSLFKTFKFLQAGYATATDNDNADAAVITVPDVLSSNNRSAKTL